MTALSTFAPGSLPREGTSICPRWQTRTLLRRSSPTGDCCFETLSYVGDYAYEQLTGKSAYDQTDWTRYETLLAELEQDIVYKGGIEFPREGRS